MEPIIVGTLVGAVLFLILAKTDVLRLFAAWLRKKSKELETKAEELETKAEELRKKEKNHDQ